MKSRLAILGVATSLIAGFFHFVLFMLDISGGSSNPYLDIYYFFVAPAVFFLGVLMVLAGRQRAKRRLLTEGDTAVASKGLQWSVGTVLVAVGLLVPVLGFTTYTSYSIYHHTESIEFCGASCHEPMGPTMAVHHSSPHQGFRCTECHVGDGPRGYAEAKMNGTRQLYQTLANSFHRPIVAPRRVLNVPREACSKCHVPGNSSHFRLEHRVRIASDESNTFRPLFMSLKTARNAEQLIHAQSFHWHKAQIEYAALDEKATEIPWVRSRRDGQIRVFRSDGLPASARPPAEVHEMACIDCHGRVGHVYPTPDDIIGGLFIKGDLDYTFPYLKRESTRLFMRRYEGLPEAKLVISSELRKFYENQYPEIASGRASALEHQIRIITDAFAHNIFPEMLADWRAYPDNSAHKHTAGCFRCHDGRHQAEDGTVISHDCVLCHDFYQEQVRDDGVKVLLEGKYRHPWDLSKAGHDSLLCNDCHDGGPTPPANCVGCHRELSRRHPARAPGFPVFVGAPLSLHADLECKDCHGQPEIFDDETLLTNCSRCHDDSYPDRVAGWRHQADTARAAALAAVDGAAPSPWRDACLETLENLDTRRVVHNLEYTIEILQAIANGPPPSP